MILHQLLGNVREFIIFLDNILRDCHGGSGAVAQRESEEGFEVKRREGSYSNSLTELKPLVLECPGGVCLLGGGGVAESVAKEP